MHLGISTACTYPKLTEKAVEMLCKSGVSDMEIFFNSACELEGNVLKEIKKTVSDFGVNVTSIHPFTSSFEPFMLFSDYQRRFEDGLEYFKKYLDTANALDCNVVVLHGDRAERDYCDDRYIERYNTLYTLSQKSGVYLAQENVARCRSRDLEFIKKMKTSLGDNLRFVLDLKQARRSGVDFELLADAMGDKICHVHLNDYNQNHDCLLPGAGVCDFKRVFQKLSEVGFNGSGVIEVYRENYGDYNELLKSLDYLKQKL